MSFRPSLEQLLRPAAAVGILQVEVADRGWQRELANLAPRYVALINKYSATAVKRIEFVVKA